MRIGVQAWGSESELRPFGALAAALARAGHDVTLVVTGFEACDHSRFKSPGVRLRTLATPIIPDLDASRVLGERLLTAKTPADQSRMVHRLLFEPVLPQLLEAAKALCAESDVVVGHSYLHPLGAAADRAGVPWVSVELHADAIPTRSCAPSGIATKGGTWNAFWWNFNASMRDRTMLSGVNDIRTALGLGRFEHTLDAWHSRLLNLVATSPTLCPPQPDWDASHRVCGFLHFPKQPDPDVLPVQLAAFLAAGDAPVFFGFGSATPVDPDRAAATRSLIERAVRVTGLRAVIQGLGPTGTSRDGATLHIGRAPHGTLFPRCATIVHHGGAGTVQAALASGVPSVIVPHVTDQFTWGDLLHRRGAAPKPLPRRTLEPAPLAAAVVEAARSMAMRTAVKELRDGMASEDGCAEAIRAIQEVAADARPAAASPR